MLSDKQVKEYKENGFVIMDYILPKETLDEIKSLHKNLLDKHPEFRDYCPTLLKYDLNFLKYAKDPEILRSSPNFSENPDSIFFTEASFTPFLSRTPLSIKSSLRFNSRNLLIHFCDSSNLSKVKLSFDL